jgi:hypothetical protein
MNIQAAKDKPKQAAGAALPASILAAHVLFRTFCF